MLQTNWGEKASHFPMTALKDRHLWVQFPLLVLSYPKRSRQQHFPIHVYNTDLEGIRSSSWVNIKNLGRNPGGKVFTLSTYMKVLGISPDEGG